MLKNFSSIRSIVTKYSNTQTSGACLRKLSPSQLRYFRAGHLLIQNSHIENRWNPAQRAFCGKCEVLLRILLFQTEFTQSVYHSTKLHKKGEHSTFWKKFFVFLWLFYGKRGEVTDNNLQRYQCRYSPTNLDAVFYEQLKTSDSRN